MTRTGPVVALALLSAAAPRSTAAQAAAGEFELTIANIMRGPEHVGEPPTDVRWSDDGRWVHFRWKPGGRPWNEPLSPWRVRADGTGLEQITFNPTFDGFPMFSPDGRKLVFGSNRNAKAEGETNVFVAEWGE